MQERVPDSGENVSFSMKMKDFLWQGIRIMVLVVGAVVVIKNLPQILNLAGNQFNKKVLFISP